MSRQRSLAVDIVEVLRQQALREGAAGTFLGTKRDLQDQFGVSIGTVNEAVRILQLRGLVELRPGPRGGVFSAAPSGALKLAELALNFHGDPTVMKEALEVRDALEPALWLELASNHTDKTIRRLRDALDDMAAAISDPTAYLKANWEFHRRAASASRNSLFRTLYLGMLDLMTSALDDVDGSLHRSRSLAVGSWDNVQAHEHLIDAVLSGDPEQVVDAVVAHVAGGRQRSSTAVTRTVYEGRAGAATQ